MTAGGSSHEPAQTPENLATDDVGGMAGACLTSPGDNHLRVGQCQSALICSTLLHDGGEYLFVDLQCMLIRDAEEIRHGLGD
jgi:hypothetical protein